jgi:flavin reductase (DIM6/NTAB) family NADH-FMN oxidoreductase RutF
MTKSNIALEQWTGLGQNIWDSHWFLLTAGDFSSGEYNTMTISWGAFGNLWNKPFAMVVVRLQRYTFQFMEKSNDFSLCAFPMEKQPILSMLGSKSGRDGDKIKESGLTVLPSAVIGSPIFEEAALQIECKKIYWDDLNPEHFLAGYIQRNYAMKDYHRMYFGEIVHISAEPDFLKP